MIARRSENARRNGVRYDEESCESAYPGEGIPQAPHTWQTMAEYSLILSAIAIVVFAVYRTMGQTVENLVVWGSVHNDLLAT
jgi:Flp pilus assembly pilin Flp